MGSFTNIHENESKKLEIHEPRFSLPFLCLQYVQSVIVKYALIYFSLKTVVHE